VLDCFPLDGRRSMRDDMRAQLVVEALEMAVRRRLHSTLGYLSPMNYEQLDLEKEEMKEKAA
jgi:transposase InsO family protein